MNPTNDCDCLCHPKHGAGGISDHTERSCPKCTPTNDMEKLDSQLEILWNQALDYCLQQVRGEITEEERIEKLKHLNNEGRKHMADALAQSRQAAVREFAEEVKMFLESADPYNKQVKAWWVTDDWDTPGITSEGIDKILAKTEGRE